jgi:hypothetical protein
MPGHARALTEIISWRTHAVYLKFWISEEKQVLQGPVMSWKSGSRGHRRCMDLQPAYLSYHSVLSSLLEKARGNIEETAWALSKWHHQDIKRGVGRRNSILNEEKWKRCGRQRQCINSIGSWITNKLNQWELEYGLYIRY